MVRLKGLIQIGAKKPQIYFNSTMVRLKDRMSLAALQQKLEFQFHYGTIKSLPFL